MNKLLEMSRRYGADPALVLAKGGNTSKKSADTLWVKTSGAAMSTMEEKDVVALDRALLEKVFTNTYDPQPLVAESQVWEELLQARQKGQWDKRPSVESLMHHLFPQTYVVHLHPTLLNGYTCSVNGQQELARRLPDALWLGLEKPGYAMAVATKKALADYQAKAGKAAQVLVVANHGAFFAADTPEEIDALIQATLKALELGVATAGESVEFNVDRAAQLAPAIRMLYNQEAKAVVRFVTDSLVAGFVADKAAFAPLQTAFTPDHLMYCRTPLWVEAQADTAALSQAFADYRQATGCAPKVIAVEGLGVFCCGTTFAEAEYAKELFLDSVAIATLAAQLGGAVAMPQEICRFIQEGQVGSTHAKCAFAPMSQKRLAGKISIITGAGQGFGKGIAECMAEEGAFTVIADMNVAAAQQVADDLCAKYGQGTAIALMANVGDEDAVKAMVDQTVLTYGGLDILVNNAGIARAGGLEEMTRSTFELVTTVNYTAFFLCTKYCTRPMKIQNAVSPDYAADIISINSKSGLAGSNKNFAYAGSKFGGIGLTQSFALELAPYNIKVNAICPGNFLDGPLWSDPEKGLFVQYLNAGKVPGAKNVEDVRKFYMAKVPLNRGCLPSDVAKAVSYCVEQKYETGQAIPVTGGQEMLK